MKFINVIQLFLGGSSSLCLFNNIKLKYRQAVNTQQTLLDVKKH